MNIRRNAVKIPAIHKIQPVVKSEIIAKGTELKRIAVCIPFYKRFRVTEFVFKYYFNLKQELKDEIDIVLIAVGSEGLLSRALAENNGFYYAEYSNRSVSLKYNEAFRQAKKFNPDAVIKVDSDSIISKEIFYYYLNCLNRGVDYTGILDIYFAFKNHYCYWSGYVGKRKGETTGVGRFMSSKLLDLLNWNVINKETTIVCDYWMSKSIDDIKGIKKETKKCKNINGYVIDIKTDFQITQLENIIYKNTYSIRRCPINLSSIAYLLLEKPKYKK